MTDHEWKRAVLTELAVTREMDTDTVDVLFASLCDERTSLELRTLPPEEAARMLTAPVIATPAEHHTPMPEHPLEPSFIVAFFRKPAHG